jgi:HPt (histidine-containing phosphotransfer) domain-containing protein
LSLRAALGNGDMATLRIDAHTLKGAVGNLSAGAAFAVAGKLEDLARAGDPTAAAYGLEVLEGELDRLRPALRVLLAVPCPRRSLTPAPV